MNDYQQTLYSDLMALVAGSKKKMFFFKDHERDGNHYRVFSYHMGSYSDWLLPSALECRGIMFQMNGEEPIALASLPFPKFFNVYEASDDINTLAEALVRDGRLSEDVFNRFKKRNKK